MESTPLMTIPQKLFAESDSKLSLADIHLILKGTSRQTAEDVQIAVAEAITTSALRVYWKHLSKTYNANRSFAEPTSHHPDGPFRKEYHKVAQWLGEAISGLPVLHAAYHVGLIYTTLLPAAYRTKNGVFYTPPILAERLLDQAEAAGLDWKTCKVLDPACGGSAFLVPVALRMVASLRGSDPHMVLQNIRARLFGWEIDPFAAWLANFFIEAACLPISVNTGRSVAPSIETRDSLRVSQLDSTYDLVIGNPPFGRLRLEPDMRRRYRRSLYGHANLYGLFTELAVRLTKPGGLVAFITPASFLAGEYFKSLRALLWNDAPPVTLDFVANRKDVFDGVLQETVLATYRKGGTRRPAIISIVRTSGGDTVTIDPAGMFHLPECPQAPWILSRLSDDRVLTEHMRSFRERLADWGYRVSTGPLVWNRHKSQLCDEPGDNRVPIVWAESVTTDGRFRFRCEKRNHRPFLRLRPTKDDWLKVVRPCVLLQRTTAKEQRRRLIAARMSTEFIEPYGSVTVENHLNMLYPVSENPRVDPDVLAAFLNSYAADRAFRCQSGSVAVSAYELRSLPLPDADDLLDLSRAVGRGASRKEIDSACNRLYGMDYSIPKSNRGEIPGRWYAVNTRESIRDDTLRGGLIPNGAVVERSGLPTTSPAPRYALQVDFAALLKPGRSIARLDKAITSLREKHLSAEARARIAFQRKGLGPRGDAISITFPNGEIRRMAPGPSSIISQAVMDRSVKSAKRPCSMLSYEPVFP